MEVSRHFCPSLLVNKGFIIMAKKSNFYCKTNKGNPERGKMGPSCLLR